MADLNKIMRNNSSDDFQTPPIALKPLLKYIHKSRLIWEPACGKGNLVNELRRLGYVCIATDINDTGFSKVDFLSNEALKLLERRNYSFDIPCIITNPPYRLKDEFFEKCYEIGFPFALLCPISTLGSVRRQDMFREHGIEIILLGERIHFETPNQAEREKEGKKSNCWFDSAWFTWGLNIGRSLTFGKLDRNRKDSEREWHSH